MRPLRANEIRGNWATLLLPVLPDDGVDLGLLREEIRLLRQANVDGVYSNGTAGEFYTQSEPEFDLLSGLIAEECERHALPFQLGAAHPSPQVALDRLRRARALRPSAIQIVLPDWFPPSMEEIHRFLDRMEAVADPVPLILYNPPHAKRCLVPAEWTEVIGRHPRIQGIKVAGGDEGWYRDMQPVTETVSVFIPGHFLATGLARGARGSYSNVACLSPAGAQRWYARCIDDPTAGQAFQERICRFLFDEVVPFAKAHRLSNMACDKVLAAAGGWLPGLTPNIRWPYLPFPQLEVVRLARVARASLPELFED